MNRTILLLVSLLFGLPMPALASELMYVFFPSTTRAKVMQEKIQAQCPGVAVTVFGRQRDFSKLLESEPPHFLLAPNLVVDTVNQYKSVLTASRLEKTDQQYFLVSINAAVSLDKLSGKRVGTVDLLDARNMSEFLEDKLQSKLRVKRVTKVEDLLPLITFNAVDAIFVSESDLSFLRSKTELNLVTQETSVRLGIATLAEREGATSSRTSVTCVGKFGSELNGMFGVQKWR